MSRGKLGGWIGLGRSCRNGAWAGRLPFSGAEAGNRESGDQVLSGLFKNLGQQFQGVPQSIGGLRSESDPRWLPSRRSAAVSVRLQLGCFMFASALVLTFRQHKINKTNKDQQKNEQKVKIVQLKLDRG